MEESSAGAAIAPQPQQPQVPPLSPSNMTRLPGPIDLLKEAWVIYKKKKDTIIRLSLIPLLFLAIPLGILIGGIVMGTLQPQLESTAMILLALGLFILVLILVLIFYVIYYLVYLSYMLLIKDRDNVRGVKSLLQESKGYVLGFLVITFLVSFIAMGGFFLFFIPGIIFSFWFSQSVYVMIAENKRGWNALLTSKEYVKGLFWPIVGRQFALGLLLLGIQLPFMILMVLFKSWELPDYYSNIMQLLLNLASFFVITPLSIIYGYLLFGYIKQKKGEIQIPAVTTGTKVKYLLVGLVGLIIPAIVMSAVIFVYSMVQNQQRVMQLRNVELRQQYQQLDQNSEDLLLDPANESFY